MLTLVARVCPICRQVNSTNHGQQGTGSALQAGPIKIDKNIRTNHFNRYISGATGTKNIMILMDISSSMLIGEDILRIDLAKQAAAAVIKTLSETDFVGLVTYNMQAAKFSSVLQAYGSSVKSSLDEFLGKIVASGRTNITLGKTSADSFSGCRTRPSSKNFSTPLITRPNCAA